MVHIKWLYRYTSRSILKGGRVGYSGESRWVIISHVQRRMDRLSRVVLEVRLVGHWRSRVVFKGEWLQSVMLWGYSGISCVHVQGGWVNSCVCVWSEWAISSVCVQAHSLPPPPKYCFACTTYFTPECHSDVQMISQFLKDLWEESTYKYQ